VHWLDAGNDELLPQLRVLNGYAAAIAAAATRLSNRLRDALTGNSPLERLLDPRHSGVRETKGRSQPHRERDPEALAPPGEGTRHCRDTRELSSRLPCSSCSSA